MNNVSLLGRLVADPNIRYSANGGDVVAKFRVAVPRKFKQEGQPEADFISCTAFKKTAEIIEKHFFKGSRIALTGRIQTGSYKNNDNQMVYTTDVIVDSVDFIDPKSATADQKPAPSASQEDFMNIPDNIDEELPFA